LIFKFHLNVHTRDVGFDFVLLDNPLVQAFLSIYDQGILGTAINYSTKIRSDRPRQTSLWHIQFST